MALGNTYQSSTDEDSNVEIGRLKTVVETIEPIEFTDIGIDESDVDAS